MSVKGQDSEKSQSRLEKLVGRQIGSFHVTGFLNQGFADYGFLAYHVNHNSPVVLRVMDPQLAYRNPKLLLEIMGEVRQATRLHHRNLVRILDCMELEGLSIIVMEYVDGLSVADLLSINGRVCEERSLEIALFVSEVLAAAAKADISHGDIKPGSILITKSHFVKLANIGLTRGAKGYGSMNDDDYLSSMSSINYRAPELLQDSWRPSPISDIYSLGCVLYQMVSGMLPHRAKTFGELKQMMRDQKAVPLLDAMNEVSRPCSEIISGMIAKDPVKRVPDYGKVIEGLRAALAHVRSIGVESSASRMLDLNPKTNLFQDSSSDAVTRHE